MTKKQIGACVGLFLLGLGFGRFSLPAKIVTETKTVQVIQKAESKDTNKADHSVVTTTKKPDGTVVTVVQKNVTTAVVDDKTASIAKSSDTTKTITYNTQQWTLGALALTQPLANGNFSYGAIVQYRILGPIQIGALGTSNGTIGATIGISF